MNFTEFFSYVAEHPEEAALVVFICLNMLQAVYMWVQKRWTAKEAALHVINILKDEKKMDFLADPGGAFSPATLDKARKVAEIAGVSQATAQAVEQAINDVNGKEGIKVASIGGKQIYISQVGAIGTALASALRLIRGIVRR